MKRDILIVGSLNMDMTIRMKRMPQKGETVMGKNLSYIPGGKGANQACASGKLGGRATMLGCVGKDSFGKRQLDNLQKNNIEISYIKETETYPTGTAVIYVEDEGDNSIVVVAGANEGCDKEYLMKYDFLFQAYDFFVFQMEIPYEAVYYGISRAKELEKTTILNPAPAPEEIPAKILEKIDYLTPNETELIKLSGLASISEENIRKGARILLSRGVKNVLVTLGDKGVLLVNQNAERIFPARKVQAIDSTAAGDCFNGAFVTALAEGRKLEDAISFANLASSIAVTRKGAQSSIPDRKEVEALTYKTGVY